MSDIYGIAKSGLKAYKEGLATTGQNIANVGNAAYARREAPVSEVTSGKDILQVSNTAGFGVRVDGITRAFDQFIETQLQSASSGFSFSTAQATVLNQLETVVRPAEGSVSQKIQELFSSLNSVAQDPSDLASRQVAANASMALVNSITTVANGISDLRTFVSQDLESNVGQVNNVLDQLANIQNQLLGISSSNRGPNELLDKRDALLKDLSELMDIDVEYKESKRQKDSIYWIDNVYMVKGIGIVISGTLKTGEIKINSQEVDDFTKSATLSAYLLAPLTKTQMQDKVNLNISVVGGGKSGQVGAIVHGLTRALVKYQNDLLPTLKREGFVTRDDRKVERKKVGLRKARKATQFSKR